MNAYQRQMPQSIVTMKNTPEKNREVWLDIGVAQIAAALKADAEWLECKRFIGGTFYDFIVKVNDIVTVEEYR